MNLAVIVNSQKCNFDRKDVCLLSHHQKCWSFIVWNQVTWLAL